MPSNYLVEQSCTHVIAEKERRLTTLNYQAYWNEKTVVAAINMVDPPIVLQVDDNKDEAQ